ncbi:hypothetical protein D5086_033736 [Populus alba]|uniref:Uncharacterized protein n=1 Tax=Populus alba TaxID=43335 RepID=A0ACC4AHL8_POPAL
MAPVTCHQIIGIAKLIVHLDEWFWSYIESEFYIMCSVARKMIVHLDEWFCYHIEDGHCELNKPVFFTEFDLSNPNKDFQPSQQGRFYKTILDIKCKSEKRKQAGAGALIWQLFV